MHGEHRAGGKRDGDRHGAKTAPSTLVTVSVSPSGVTVGAVAVVGRHVAIDVGRLVGGEAVVVGNGRDVLQLYRADIDGGLW